MGEGIELPKLGAVEKLGSALLNTSGIACNPSSINSTRYDMYQVGANEITDQCNEFDFVERRQCPLCNKKQQQQETR